jgi:hypothetical protein
MLEDIQIQLNGTSCRAVFTNNYSFDVILDEDARDHENGKVVKFLFPGQSLEWVTVMVDGWARERWQATIDEDIIDADELFEHLVQTVATEAPTGKMVTFLEVAFVASSMRGLTSLR